VSLSLYATERPVAPYIFELDLSSIEDYLFAAINHELFQPFEPTSKNTLAGHPFTFTPRGPATTFLRGVRAALPEDPDVAHSLVVAEAARGLDEFLAAVDRVPGRGIDPGVVLSAR